MVFQNDKDKIWQIIGLEGFKSPIEGTNKRMGFYGLYIDFSLFSMLVRVTGLRALLAGER